MVGPARGAHHRARRWDVVILGGALPGLVAAAWAAGWLTRRYGPAAGAVGGAVAALHPLPVLMSSRCMSDEFHAALGWAALACAALALWGRSDAAARRWAVASGALFAAHLLTRSSGLLTLAALLAYSLLRRPPRRRTGLIVPP